MSAFGRRLPVYHPVKIESVGRKRCTRKPAVARRYDLFDVGYPDPALGYRNKGPRKYAYHVVEKTVSSIGDCEQFSFGIV